jgi:ferredoxin, 2Fe-2S
MPKITFIEHNGQVHEVQAEVGQSVMQIAMNNMIAGIIADCGGNCSCATCHVYVDAAWLSKLVPADKNEQEMLECALYIKENSRLSCQIPITPQLEGLIVHLPESQT